MACQVCMLYCCTHNDLVGPCALSFVAAAAPGVLFIVSKQCSYVHCCSLLQVLSRRHAVELPCAALHWLACGLTLCAQCSSSSCCAARAWKSTTRSRAAFAMRTCEPTGYALVLHAVLGVD